MKIIITAGPTQEPIDLVRYITNASTGTVGYLIAEAAAEKNHEVILISGPSNLAKPKDIDFIQIRTAGQMYETVKKKFYHCDALIMAAAICDFRPINPLNTGKIKKEEVSVIELERTPDILSRLNHIRENQLMVGFALEVTDLEKKAIEKMKKKKLDLIIVNRISPSNFPFGDKRIDAIIIDKEENKKTYTDISKKELAIIILEKIEKLRADLTVGEVTNNQDIP